jgi:hypothetical protein
MLAVDLFSGFAILALAVLGCVRVYEPARIGAPHRRRVVRRLPPRGF